MDMRELEEQAISSARAGPLGDLIEHVRVSPAQLGDDDLDFLRVEVRLKRVGRPEHAALLATLERIERDLSELDDRYPSVRFLDAA